MAQSRPYRPADLSDLLRLVSRIAAARWPGSAYRMTSDVAWQLPGADPEANVRLWYDAAGRLAGYAWFDPPTDVDFDAREDVPATSAVFAEMLDWAADRRRVFPAGRPAILDCRSMRDWEALFLEPGSGGTDAPVTLVASAFDRDAGRVALLERRGFAPTDHTMPYLRRSLDVPIPAPPLPDGARLRHVTETDLEERVAVHVAAWWPASGFTLESYLATRALETYESELDLVLESRDGVFESYCIAWRDPALGVGSFEPVGTRRSSRRRGLARLVSYEGLRRLKARDMAWANVQTAGFNERAIALYESCGFELVDTKRSYAKSLSGSPVVSRQ